MIFFVLSSCPIHTAKVAHPGRQLTVRHQPATDRWQGRRSDSWTNVTARCNRPHLSVDLPCCSASPSAAVTSWWRVPTDSHAPGRHEHPDPFTTPLCLADPEPGGDRIGVLKTGGLHRRIDDLIAPTVCGIHDGFQRADANGAIAPYLFGSSQIDINAPLQIVVPEIQVRRRSGRGSSRR